MVSGGNWCTNLWCCLRSFRSQIGGIDMELFRLARIRDAVTFMKNTVSSPGTALQVCRKERHDGQVLFRLGSLFPASQQP